MSTRKGPRLLGVSVPQDKGPLTGKPRKENARHEPGATKKQQKEAKNAPNESPQAKKIDAP